MAKMKCRQCEHFEECRSKNIILDVTTSYDNWQNPFDHVYVFGLIDKVPSYCPHVKEMTEKEIGYADFDCPNCGRHRVVRYESGLEICEKCNWCIQTKQYWDWE